jgi:VIT1/CCC1 family predicted Fe2+/Mn2+ transporter
MQNKGENMKTLNRIFYIWSEASVSVLFAVGALVELVCFVALPGVFAVIAACAAVAFALIAFFQGRYVYREAKRAGFI